MFSARLIFLVAAISLICHDFTLGEEPNEDRIGAILSAIEALTVKVDGMEKKMNGIEKKVDKVDSDVMHYNTWKFVGRGFEESHDDIVNKYPTTKEECLEFCQTKRMSDGGEWNGVVWFVSTRGCLCVKNDGGHHKDSGALHFRAQ